MLRSTVTLISAALLLATANDAAAQDSSFAKSEASADLMTAQTEQIIASKASTKLTATASMSMDMISMAAIPGIDLPAISIGLTDFEPQTPLAFARSAPTASAISTAFSGPIGPGQIAPSIGPAQTQLIQGEIFSVEQDFSRDVGDNLTVEVNYDIAVQTPQSDVLRSEFLIDRSDANSRQNRDFSSGLHIRF